MVGSWRYHAERGSEEGFPGGFCDSLLRGDDGGGICIGFNASLHYGLSKSPAAYGQSRMHSHAEHGNESTCGSEPESIATCAFAGSGKWKVESGKWEVGSGKWEAVSLIP
ncbi:hypothetical protein [Endozoicomonas sp.]|uniref:hypothetical protein n=1 Tax=Endozoicomonas sp. TaxID=1892382 RepID=UPI00383B31C4